MANVLLVADDLELGRGITSVLVASGHEVHQAATAATAERLLEQLHVDLAVVDAVLPDGDGIELVAGWRIGRKAFAVIVISSVIRDVAEWERLRTEIDLAVVLYKPLAASEVVDKIVAVLAGGAAFEDAIPEPPSAASFVAQFTRLRASFALKLGPRIEELERLVAEARTSAEGARRLREAAHNLHGTAGSYGFGKVGTAARAIEERLNGLAPSLALPEAIAREFESDLQAARRGLPR